MQHEHGMMVGTGSCRLTSIRLDICPTLKSEDLWCHSSAAGRRALGPAPSPRGASWSLNEVKTSAEERAFGMVHWVIGNVGHCTFSHISRRLAHDLDCLDSFLLEGESESENAIGPGDNPRRTG